MTLSEGAIVGSYRILGKLGEGGMGAVYRAVDTMIQREVAIKALRPEISSQPDVLDRFRSEAVLLARLNHPSIAQLYSFFSDGGQFYMAMEYVPGNSFEQLIHQRGAMGWQHAFGFLVQILDGIGHAHAAGILHRDLKPANVMLTPSGKIKLMDFGIAQALGGARMTRHGRIIGTLEYLAPERIQGKPADTRSDLYAVGVMLFEMLSGRLPFQSDSEYELLQQQIQQAPPELHGLGIQVPAEVEAVVRTALEKDPQRRYTDADDFSAALTALLPLRKTGNRQIVAMPPPAPPLPVASSRTPSLMAKPVFWLASAGALVVLAMGIVYATLRTPAPAPVTVADSGQLYSPPPSRPALPVDSTPVLIVSPSAKEPTPPAPSPSPKPVRPMAPDPAPTRTAPPAEPTPAPEPAPPAVAENPPAPVAPPARPPIHAGISRLSDAHSIYVAGGPGELDSYVREEIERQLGVRLRLAASLADADVVMRVSMEEQKGKGIAQAGRIIGVKDHATVRAVIVDARTNRVLWQDGAGDRKPIIGSFRGDPVRRLAERIVKELRDAYGR